MEIDDLKKAGFVTKRTTVKDGFEEVLVHQLLHKAVTKISKGDDLTEKKLISSNTRNQFTNLRRKKARKHSHFEVTL